MKKFVFIFLIAHCSLQIARADWVNVTNEITNLNINALTATGPYIFVGNNQYVYRSSNNGDNWQQVYNLSALALASNGSYIYRGYQNGYNYSTNYGANWLFAGLNQWTLSLLANGNYVYAGCFWPIPGGSTNRGVWISSNYGANWTQTALNNIDIYSLTVSGSYLFAGGYNSGVGGGVFVSTNNGLNWTNPLLVGGDQALTSNGNIIYGGGGNGIYKSTNYGTNWTQVSTLQVHALAMYGNIVFAGGGFWVSTDSGTSWVQRTEGMGNIYVNDIGIHNGFVFAGTDGTGVFRRLLNELVSIEPISNIMPKKPTLEQNFPNPFNSMTKIRFQISERSNTLIKLFNVAGKEYTLFINHNLYPGQYETTFDASSFSSGIYFYSLIINNIEVETKKCILVK